MSIQNLIEERNKKFDEEFVYSDLEATSGQPAKKPWRPTHQLRDAETTALKQFHSDSINMIIDGVVEMVNVEKRIHKQLSHEWIGICLKGEKHTINPHTEKVEVLEEIISQLQTLKK